MISLDTTRTTAKSALKVNVRCEAVLPWRFEHISARARHQRSQCGVMFFRGAATLRIEWASKGYHDGNAVPFQCVWMPGALQLIDLSGVAPLATFSVVTIFTLFYSHLTWNQLQFLSRIVFRRSLWLYCIVLLDFFQVIVAIFVKCLGTGC